MASFIRCSKSLPCVICGRHDKNCSTSQLTGMKFCRGHREDSPPDGWRCIGEDKTTTAFKFVPDYGHGTHYNDPAQKARIDEAKRVQREAREAKRNRSNSTSATPSPATPSAKGDELSKTFIHIRDNMRPMTERERELIAARLRVPIAVIDLLGVMYLENDGNFQPAYVFPELDADRNIIGYSLRYSDKNNTKLNHGKRGLYIPHDWKKVFDLVMEDRLLILCEGASDTLALRAMGFNVIGRPSNKGGVDLLAKLLGPIDHNIMIVMLGENDLKPDGEWPGREGAEYTSQEVANLIRRPIRAAMPPPGIKDAREMIKSRIRVGDDGSIKLTREEIAAAGDELKSHCFANLEVFNPALSPAEMAAMAAAASARLNPPAVNVVGIGTQTASPAAPASAPASPVYDFPPLDFTAADCVPPPDPFPQDGTPTPPKCNRCPNPRGVNMRHDADHNNATFWFDCKRLTCEVCEKKKRHHWQATINHHLTDHGKVFSPLVWTFWCDAAAWSTVHHNLQVKRSSYFRLETTPGRLLIVSAEKPTSAAISGLAEITTDDAAFRLCSIIASAHSIREKQLTSSRDWKLLEEMRSPIWKGWRRIAKVTHSQQAIWEVLELRGIDFKHISHSGEFWGWTSWQWTDSQCEAAGGWREIFNDIAVGEVFPDIDDSAWDWREDGSNMRADAYDGARGDANDGEFENEYEYAGAGAGASTGQAGGFHLEW